MTKRKPNSRWPRIVQPPKWAVKSADLRLEKLEYETRRENFYRSARASDSFIDRIRFRFGWGSFRRVSTWLEQLHSPRSGSYGWEERGESDRNQRTSEDAAVIFKGAPHSFPEELALFYLEGGDTAPAPLLDEVANLALAGDLPSAHARIAALLALKEIREMGLEEINEECEHSKQDHRTASETRRLILRRERARAKFLGIPIEEWRELYAEPWFRLRVRLQQFIAIGVANLDPGPDFPVSEGEKARHRSHAATREFSLWRDREKAASGRLLSDQETSRGRALTPQAEHDLRDVYLDKVAEAETRMGSTKTKALYEHLFNCQVRRQPALRHGSQKKRDKAQKLFRAGIAYALAEITYGNKDPDFRFPRDIMAKWAGCRQAWLDAVCADAKAWLERENVTH